MCAVVYIKGSQKVMPPVFLSPYILFHGNNDYISEIVGHSYSVMCISFRSTDGSTAVDSKMAEFNMQLKQ
jgi:hypothetical protein